MSCNLCTADGVCNKDYTSRSFGRLGSSITDLLTKGYNFRHSISTRKITKSGIGLESGFLNKDIGSGIEGYIAGNYSVPTLELDGRVSTENEAFSKVRYHQPKNGSTVSLDCDTYGETALGVEYQDVASVLTSVFHTNFKRSKFQGTFDVGGSYQIQKQLSAGAQVQVDTASGFQDLNVAAEYETGPNTVTLATADRFSKLNASYFVKATPTLDVGAQADVVLQGPKQYASTLALASEYRVDRDTTTKLKLDSKGVVCTAIEYRLFNPLLRFGLSTSMDVSKGRPDTKQFGIGLTFGDYTSN